MRYLQKQSVYQNKKIVMCGCHESGYEVVKSLLEAGIPISCFVTIDKALALKSKVSGYKSFAGLAKKNKIPVYFAKDYSLKNSSDVSFFKKNKFDLLIQGGWQRLFPVEILKELKIGAVGVHGSSERLPKGRGRSPINWSLIENRDRFIIHYFLLKPGIDDGDVFHFETFDINPWDTCRTLYYKNSIVTKKTLIEWMPRLLAGNFVVQPQVGEPSYYPKRTGADGLIDWNQPDLKIYNLVRAVTHPYPGAFTYLKNKKIMIWKAQPFDSRLFLDSSQPGQVLEVFETGDFVVKCGENSLLVTDYEGRIIKGSVFSKGQK